MCADKVLNLTPTFTSSHTFSTDDITGTFSGITQGSVEDGEAPVIDFTAIPIVTKEGVSLYPVNSEFGYNVTDFVGAIEKDYVDDPAYEEGYVGDLKGEGGEQVGIVISNTPTDFFKTPALLGTWLAGLGGNTVKASTEHYIVMQNILSDQHFPEDPDAVYQLDDNLRMVGGDYDGQYIVDILPQVGDVNGDGVTDIKDILLPNETTIDSNIAVGDDYSVTMKDDGKLLYRWGNTIKKPNDIRIEATLDLPDEWSEPDNANNGLIPLFRVTQAELVTNHTITNNPNDQIRPEDFENESATGTIPTYEILADGKWVTTDDYYAGDGTLYPAGTVLRDPALADTLVGTTIAATGATSSDLEGGYTNAWYTTMDREPFEASLTPDGTEYIVGPRWRLQSDKYGQDLPSVDMPLDPSLPPPPTNDELKYEVGTDTTTVINLLDWAQPVSPLSISAGYQHMSGTVTENGLNMTEGFDVAFYVKGDIKPATLYNTELVMTYEELTIHGSGGFITGQDGSDYLVGQGGNTFIGDANTSEAAEDLFVLSYGAGDNWTQIVSSSVLDFQVGLDTLGLIDFDVTEDNFEELVGQVVIDGDLHISLNSFEIVVLTGVAQTLDYENFLILNRFIDERIVGTEFDDYLVGDQFDNVINGLESNDTILGLEGDDLLRGGTGDDVIFGGDGVDRLSGDAGADQLNGGAGRDIAVYASSTSGVTVNLETNVNTGGDAEGDTLTGIVSVTASDHDDVITGNARVNLLTGRVGNDTLSGADGNDVLNGGAGADVLNGGNGVDTAKYTASSAVVINLETGEATGGEAEGDSLSGIERIAGSKFADVLTGDSMNNLLLGDAGDDTLNGGEGHDVLIGGVGADVLNGGDGNDRVDYTRSASGVSINLDTGAVSGGEATGDILTSIERIFGSNFADTLVGSAGSNTLKGLEGNDILDGGDGNDALFGDGGQDVFIFGSGSDTLDGGDGEDFALFAGAQSDFTIVNESNGSWQITELSSGDIDSLISIETLGFSDGYIIA
ncbi:calcium-binding protein [Sulfitobacter sp.]|uniref:calcium-binding protein n=1 Tax=Sulfitobacter sp. TaxID=1903071 RepID=UPI003003473B